MLRLWKKIKKFMKKHISTYKLQIKTLPRIHGVQAIFVENQETCLLKASRFVYSFFQIFSLVWVIMSKDLTILRFAGFQRRRNCSSGGGCPNCYAAQVLLQRCQALLANAERTLRQCSPWSNQLSTTLLPWELVAYRKVKSAKEKAKRCSSSEMEWEITRKHLF